MAQTDRTTGLIGNLGIKAPVKAASTANLTLSGEQTVDGIALVTGDRILVKDQTDASENGLYEVDTGDWTRTKDFNGTYDTLQGTMLRVNQGTTNGGGLFFVSTADDITIGTTDLTFQRMAINYVASTTVTATAGQTLVNLGLDFQIASNNLAVYVNGIRQVVDEDYTETSTSSITFTYGLALDDEVVAYAGSPLGQLVAVLASGISIADAADYFNSTTVEGALAERAGAIDADNGDASVTLTYNADDLVQRWNTALSANRTVTLSTTNAKEGAEFHIVRASGATGAYTLTVGSLATLRAPGEWCMVRYDAGTAAWVLVGYGILPSAEVLAMGADPGDASATLTVGTSSRTQRWATALTADRTATLSTTGAYTGARFRILRAAAATGNFALAVVVGSTTLAKLAPSQWAEVEFSGSTWVLAGFGNLGEAVATVVELRDDFLGEEISGYNWLPMVGTDGSCVAPIVLADQIGGVVRLTTGADAGGTMALNGSQLSSHLNWRASQGGLSIAFRIAADAITNLCLFAGFTDQHAALEAPFTLAAGDALTSNATNAVGVLFDTAADTDDWWLVGVAADIDAAKEDSAVAPVAATFETWRIDIDTSGVATFYRNGSVIGSAMAAAVTASAGLTPVIAAFSRGAASRNIDVDYMLVRAQR